MLGSDSNNVCSDYEVEVPLDINQRFIRCQRLKPPFAIAGTAPPWDSLAGATINANPSLGGKGTSNNTKVSLWFQYLAGEPPAAVPVTFTLLDENRQPYARSDVRLFAPTGAPTLKPSATVTLTLASGFEGGSSLLALVWNSKGRYTGFSNRFYLILNAGCQYGQTELWLDVWNWS
jgi:hypothetical protein